MNNAKVKEIMRASFHKTFYVDRYNEEENFQYLDALVDYVLKKEDCDDYEYIANEIWKLDSRIKNIFSFNLEMVSGYFDNIELKESTMQYLVKVPDPIEIIKIARQSKDVETLLRRVNVSLLFANWSNINSEQRKNYIDIIQKQIKDTYGIELVKGEVYKVKRVSECLKTDIAVNEIVFWLSEFLDFRFSYQTSSALELLVEFEKTEMYFQIYRELLEKRDENLPVNNANLILKNIIKPFSFQYVGNDNEYFTDMSEGERALANAYVYIQDELCKYIYSTTKERLQLASKIRSEDYNLQRKQTEIEELRKKIYVLQHEIEKNRKEKELEIDKYKNQINHVQNELFSLRNFAFERQTRDDVMTDNFKLDYVKNFEDVVIVGGHIKWQNKVIEQLKGIKIISTDQNIVDWSFLNHIKIVVIVTNYISHSIYYQVMDKVTNQTIIYLDYKNTEQLRKRLIETLLRV